MSEAPTEGFKAAWRLCGRHAQAFWASPPRRIGLDTRRERLELPDGDFVNLDWVGDEGPIVVVLPGLQGNLGSSHVRGLLNECVERNWRAVFVAGMNAFLRSLGVVAGTVHYRDEEPTRCGAELAPHSAD